MTNALPETTPAVPAGSVQQWTLGVDGMTCASCVARVEKALTRVPGVAAASVNLISEAATIEVDADVALTPLLQAIVGAGYRVKEDELDLAIGGMTCASCVGRVEKALLKVPGVLATTVNLASEAARVRVVSGVVSLAALIQAVAAAGYEASVPAAVERVAKDVPGVSSALAERLTGGRYIDVDIDRKAAARYGLNIADVQSIVAGAIGGENVGETIEGLARFPINVRYPREWRDSLGALEQLPIYTPLGSQITLGTVAKVKVSDGPPMLKSENARPSGWVYIDVRGRDIASVVADLRRVVSEQVKLQPGMSLSYSGQFEFLERANARLKLVVPATLLIIFVLLYLTFARFDEALLIMATLPFALTGGAWFLYLLGFNLSVATGVGFIALAGVSAEFGVIMLLYLKNAWTEQEDVGDNTERGLIAAIREGAVQRVRPKAMTVAVIIAGLLPILWGSGTGSEVMSRIAAPMVGGMVTAPLLSLFVIPAAYRLMRRRHLPAVPANPQGKIV